MWQSFECMPRICEVFFGKPMGSRPHSPHLFLLHRFFEKCLSAAGFPSSAKSAPYTLVMSISQASSALVNRIAPTESKQKRCGSHFGGQKRDSAPAGSCIGGRKGDSVMSEPRIGGQKGDPEMSGSHIGGRKGDPVMSG